MVALTSVALRTPVARPALPITPVAPAAPAPVLEWPLAVPFFSQLELSDRKGWNNCLQACARSLLGYHGISLSEEDYHVFCDLVRDGIRDGDHWENSYTDFPWLRWVLREWFGLQADVLRSWGTVHHAIEVRRQPVILLLKNRYLEPRQYDRGPGWDASHFITLNGWDADRYFVCDPLSYWHRAPAAYSRASVELAVAQWGGVYALALD